MDVTDSYKQKKTKKKKPKNVTGCQRGLVVSGAQRGIHNHGGASRDRNRNQGDNKKKEADGHK